MLQAYRTHAAERAALGIPPLPLSVQQTEQLLALLQSLPPDAVAGDYPQA